MSGYVTVHTKGIAELTRNLGNIAVQLRGQAGDKACKAAAQLIARKARRNAPRRTGNLRKGIIVVKGDWKKYGREHTYFVTNKSGGRFKNDAWYAHIVEFGSAPHEIRATRDPHTGKLKAMLIKGEHAMRVKHPGARARPFLRPAFQEENEKAIEAMSGRVGKLLETGR